VHEVRIKDGVDAAPFFDAAKTSRLCRVHLDASWMPDAQGRQRLDVGRSRAVKVESLEGPISGREFVEAVASEAPGAFDDIETILAEIEGR
jgi:hypothetical protein